MAYATWNPSDKAAAWTLSGGDLIATNNTGGTHSALRATMFANTGKWYCEITITAKNALDNVVVGLSNSTASLSAFPSGTGQYTYGHNGAKYINGSGSAYGSGWGQGDKISILWNADTGDVIFWLNGVSQGTAGSGVSGLLAILGYGNASSGTITLTANFGESAFTYTPPAGYSGWSDTVDETKSADAAIEVDGSAGAVSFRSAARAADAAIEVGAEATHEFQLGEQPTDGAAIEVDGSAAAISFHPSARDADAAVEVGAEAAHSFLSVVRPADSAIEIGAEAVHSFEFSALYFGALTWPSLEVSATWEIESNFGDVTWPTFALSGEMQIGAALSGDLTYRYSLVGYTPASGSLEYSYSLSGSMFDSPTMSGDLIVMDRVLDAVLLMESILAGDSFRPHWRLSGTLSPESLLSAAVSISRWTVRGSMDSGVVYSGDVDVPSYEVDAVAWGEYLLTASLQRPSYVLGATVLAELAEEFMTLAMNISNRAVTEYADFDFNSYGVFRGTAYSAGASGVLPHRAGADDDNTLEIVSVLRTGKESFGSSYNKRLPRLYLVYKSLGDMRVSTFTSQDGKRTYLLAANMIAGVQTRRVPIGRGPKSPHWQIEVVNPNGEDFLVTAIQAYPEKSRRRVV